MSELKGFSEIKIGSDRSFGIVFTVVLVLVAMWPLWSGAPLRFWNFIPSGVFLGFSLFYPQGLRPLNLLWFRFGMLLGRIVNPIVLTVLFFFSIVPTAMVFRVLGKDPLRLARDSSASSYWIQRRDSEQPMGSMKNQF